MDRIGPVSPHDLARRVQPADAFKSKITAVSGDKATQSFGTALAEALGKVSAADEHAGELERQFQLGNPNVSLEETMIAGQKASVSFQAAVAVRNKVIAAYNEIMNMNV